MSEKNMILHEEITSSQADTVSVVGSARTHFAISINLHVPLRRNFLRRRAKRVREPGWSSGTACCWRSWRNWWRCGEGDTQRGWGCRWCLWCSRVGDLRVEHQGFTFSEIVQRKRLEGQTLYEAVIDTARHPQCEFSNLQQLPLTFNLDFLAGRPNNSVRLVLPHALKLEDDFVRLLCWVYN